MNEVCSVCVAGGDNQFTLEELVTLAESLQYQVWTERKPLGFTPLGFLQFVEEETKEVERILNGGKKD